MFGSSIHVPRQSLCLSRRKVCKSEIESEPRRGEEEGRGQERARERKHDANMYTNLKGNLH